jgi:hypothetical protein
MSSDGNTGRNLVQFRSIAVDKDTPIAPDIPPTVNPEPDDSDPEVPESALSVLAHNRINATFFEVQYMKRRKFSFKDPNLGLITNSEGKGMFASHFDLVNSYKAAICQLYRNDGIFRLRHRPYLLVFLQNFEPQLNREFLGSLDPLSSVFRSVYRALRRAFTSEFANEDEQVEAFSNIIFLAAQETKKCPDSGCFVLKKGSQKTLLGLGIVARPDVPARTLDAASGFLGRCDGNFNCQEKIFAVLEAKHVRPTNQGKRWHMEGTNLSLQLYNSFIGGEAHVGFAIVAGGIHVIWKEKAADGDVSTATDRYKFFTIEREFILFGEPYD